MFSAIAVLLYLLRAGPGTFLEQISRRLADSTYDGGTAFVRAGANILVPEVLWDRVDSLDLQLEHGDRTVIGHGVLALGIQDPDGHLLRLLQDLAERLHEEANLDHTHSAVTRSLLTEILREGSVLGTDEVRHWWTGLLLAALRGESNDSERRFALQETRTFSPTMANVFGELVEGAVLANASPTLKDAVSALVAVGLIEATRSRSVRLLAVCDAKRAALEQNLVLRTQVLYVTYDPQRELDKGMLSGEPGLIHRTHLRKLIAYRLTGRGERLRKALGLAPTSASSAGISQFVQDETNRIKSFFVDREFYGALTASELKKTRVNTVLSAVDARRCEPPVMRVGANRRRRSTVATAASGRWCGHHR